MKLCIISIDFCHAKIFNNRAQKHNSKLFVNKFSALCVLENKLKKFIPLLVRNQKLAQSTNHISNVFFYYSDWFIDKSFKQKLFGYNLRVFGKLKP